jgi:geranylgeranyl diphosphate synthase type II
MIDGVLKRPAELTDDFLRAHFFVQKKLAPERAKNLFASMEYSLFSGGKRFRAALTLLTAEALQVSLERALPFAAALELIHNYSLIHDDLPALDNDDFRRGQATNHRVYGEALAIMAGDGLLTEAWNILGVHYQNVPEIGLELVRILSEAAGASGMIAGQVMDLDAQFKLLKNSAATLKVDEIKTLHQLKTAALMRAATEGPAIIARSQNELRAKMRAFGFSLGFCFQIADDLHDYNPKKPEATGLPHLMGVSATRKLLEEETAKALSLISDLGARGENLRQLVNFNLKRLN